MANGSHTHQHSTVCHCGVATAERNSGERAGSESGGRAIAAVTRAATLRTTNDRTRLRSVWSFGRHDLQHVRAALAERYSHYRTAYRKYASLPAGLRAATGADRRSGRVVPRWRRSRAWLLEPAGAHSR